MKCATSEGSATTKKQGVVGVPGLRHEGDGVNHLHKSLPKSRSKPLNDVLLNSKVLSGRLETPGVAVLQEYLKAAKRAAQVPPVKVQVAHCEQFAAREKTVGHDEERTTLVKQLEDSKQRLLKLREEVSQSPAPTPVHPTDWGAQVASLQQRSTLCSRSGMLSRRRFRARRQTCRRTESLQDDAHNRELAQDSTSPPCPRWFQESFPNGKSFPNGWKTDRRICWTPLPGGTMLGLELTSKMACKAFDPVDTSAKNDRRRARVAGSSWRGEIRSVLSVDLGVMRRWFSSVNAKYGLRGVRIGEGAAAGRKDCGHNGRDTESDEERRHVIRRLEALLIDTDDHFFVAHSSPLGEVIRALEEDLCSHPRASRRVVFVPQSPQKHLFPSRTDKIPPHP